MSRSWSSLRPQRLVEAGHRLGPGLALVLVIGLAAAWISEHYGGPLLLFALLIGMAFNFTTAGPQFRAGVDFAAQRVLRLGVALLGARITLEQIASLGLLPILAVVAAVVCTMLFGRQLAHWLGLTREQGILTGGATAICGASAALAISAVLPKRAESERNTIYAVIAVTTLSTVAMVLYPVIAGTLRLDDPTAGVLIGATIHDVAQVVAAGYTISDPAGDAATYTKMMRVAMLVPVVFLLSLLFRRETREAAGGGSGRLIGLPLFLLAFVALVALNSLEAIPALLIGPMVEASRWCLVFAVAALGIKTSLGEIAALGWRPFALVLGETLFLLLLILGVLLVAGGV